MVSLVTYKVALLILVAVTGASSGGTFFYFQIQTSDLNNKVVGLNDTITGSNHQISNLNNQVSRLNGQVSQLQSQNSQLLNLNNQLLSQNSELQSQISQLQAQIKKLNQTTASTSANSTLVGTGSIDVVGYGAVQYVSFTAGTGQTKLNVTFSVASGASIVVMLLNPSQHNTLNTCNCILYGNYTGSTWQSPQSSSYHTFVDIPNPGNWYMAFFDPPGTGSERIISETLYLVTSTITLTASIIASEVTLTNGCCPSTDSFSTGGPPTAVVSLGTIPYDGHITVSWLASTNPSTRFSFTVQMSGVNVVTNSTSTGSFNIPVYANGVSNAWFTCLDYSTDQFGAHCNSNLTYSITYWH